jgi:ATP-dependent RNA helicase RhlE
MQSTEPGSEPAAPNFAALGLSPVLVRALERRGLAEPTPIQIAAIPAALAGSDVVGLSQTGSGKTLAFLLPSLSRLLDQDQIRNGEIKVLVITPTRELAIQIGEEVLSLIGDTKLRVATVFGGRGMREQVAALRAGADVVVATPGRLLDHAHRRNARLGHVVTLVLDEADRMLDMGFIDDVRRIAALTPRDRQTLLFGATMPPEIEYLSADFQRSPLVVEVARRLPPASIEQVLYPVGRHLKGPLLAHLLERDPAMESVLVFVDTKRDSDIVARQLQEMGVMTSVMHGDRSQSERETALRRLRERRVRVLVATNVAARGLDVEDISHVVNYDMPRTVDEYVHRIGRTARAEAKGAAYTFVGPEDEAMLQRIEAALGRALPRIIDPSFDYSVPTPSWAQPSARHISGTLAKAKSPADVSRRVRFKR